MARAATAATPRAPQLVPAALLLLLLVAACQRAAGAPVASELRCQCLQTVQRINPKNIQSVKVTSPGPHCDQTEVIATLKNGQAACLNPEAPMVKKIINKMLNKDGPTELISKKLTGDCTSSRPCPTGIKEDKEESSTPKAT